MSERLEHLKRDPDSALVDRLEALIRETVGRLDEGQDCAGLVSQINTLSGRTYNEGHFFELYGWQSDREAAAIAAKGTPPVLDDLTRDELVEAIQVINFAKEPNATFFLELLNVSLPNHGTADLIFYPFRHELSPKEIADELMLRRDLYRLRGVEAVEAREVELAKEVLANPDAAPWSLQWAGGIIREG